ncbi:MAG: prepilin-type N-terminal cleavage/methylation domain-containing protein [Candidatus Omnitrophica bacterium]|nr:prepilin-type N-terminal cleavage/methylation domain-containing protein [Candidatus Omnitrophota bacterium]
MQNMNKNNRKTGFTLVEILIVTMILAVISLAIFSTFSNGMKIYNRVNSEVTSEDLVIFCDRFGHDLRNSFNFSLINFTGKAEELEFAGLVNSPRMEKRSVSRIKYIFEPSTEKIKRFTGDYSAIYFSEEDSFRQALDKVKSCVFSYYYFDNKTQEFAWDQEWRKDGLPSAVRMELEFKDNPEEKFVRTFNIPVGYVVLNETSQQ